MLYDLNWLKPGQMFPPRVEAERLKTYRDNRALFAGDVEQVLPAYRTRIRAVLSKYTDVPEYDFKSDLNYWQLVTLKTGDLICGEPPTITMGSESGEVDKLRRATQFDAKLLEAVYDVSRYGDSVVRVMKDARTNKNTFIVCPPDLWFPIVSRENVREVAEHVLAWVEDVTGDETSRPRRYMLRVQEHFRGYYVNRAFQIDDYDLGKPLIFASGLNVELPSYKIGREITDKSAARVETGLDDFAIVPFQNVRTSGSVYAAVNDYDRITGILAELEVRYALENTILDKHAAPTIYAPESAFRQNAKTGEWTFLTGGAVRVVSGEQPPGYMTWDGNLESNHAMIERLEKHLYSLSEMGAIVNDDAFGASQGFEALETRMTNARLKARRLSSCLTDSVRKLISLVSQIGYGRIEPEAISVCWNDGIPNNEYREADIALKKQPFFSTASLLKDHFGKTEEDAEEEVERRQKEAADNMAGGFAFGAGAPGKEDDSGGTE